MKFEQIKESNITFHREEIKKDGIQMRHKNKLNNNNDEEHKLFLVLYPIENVSFIDISKSEKQAHNDDIENKIQNGKSDQMNAFILNKIHVQKEDLIDGNINSFVDYGFQQEKKMPFFIDETKYQNMIGSDIIFVKPNFFRIMEGSYNIIIIAVKKIGLNLYNNNVNANCCENNLMKMKIFFIWNELLKHFNDYIYMIPLNIK